VEASTRVRGAGLAVSEMGRGRPFLWGHGLLGSMAQEDDAGLFDWSSLGADVRWIRYDARGHGRSQVTPVVADYRWPNLGRDMLCLADALGVGRCVLGGVSMGCATSLHAAVQAPDRVEGLVLVGPPTAWSTRPRQARFYRFSAALVERLGLTPFRLLSGLPQPGPVNPAVARMQDALRRHLERADPAAVVSALRGAAESDLPDPDALCAIEVPTLVLAWSGDPFHPVSTAERLRELLPKSELHVAETLAQIESWPKEVGRFLAAHFSSDTC